VPDRDRKERQAFTAVVQAGIERGLDVVEAWRAARASKPSRELEARRQQAIAAHAREVHRYERRKAQLSTRTIAGTAVAGVAGTVGVIDVVAEVATSDAAVYGPSWMWLGAAVIGAVTAIIARRRQATLAPPAAFRAPIGPPPLLRPDAIGAVEAARLTRLRLQLAEVVPALDSLHPAAAHDLRDADQEASPPLHALVTRLDVLDRMRRDLDASAAKDAATTAAEQVRTRLDAGCQTYEMLLTASASLLAAPDVSRSTDEVLTPAIEALSAYTHGLQRSAETFGT
jgi:hypothetical protein